MRATESTCRTCGTGIEDADGKCRPELRLRLLLLFVCCRGDEVAEAGLERRGTHYCSFRRKTAGRGPFGRTPRRNRRRVGCVSLCVGSCWEQHIKKFGMDDASFLGRPVPRLASRHTHQRQSRHTAHAHACVFTSPRSRDLSTTTSTQPPWRSRWCSSSPPALPGASHGGKAPCFMTPRPSVV